MSKKLADTFQPKITRNDRFAQMSQQEKMIEQKKKEILAKLEAKQKAAAEAGKSTNSNSKTNKSPVPKEDPKKQLNVFTNDGSFLDQFKQMKDKRLDSKLRSFKSKDMHSDDHKSRWSQRNRRSPSPKERPKPRISRFDRQSPFEQKITINTSSFSTPLMNQQHPPPPLLPPTTYELVTQHPPPPVSLSPQNVTNVTGQPLLKNIVGPFTTTVTQTTEPVIAAPPVLINVPPPQIVQGPLVLPNTQQTVIVQAPTSVALQPNTVLTTVTLPPPNILQPQTLTVSAPNGLTVTAPAALPVPPPVPPPPTSLPVLSAVELASIPPPNPIQVQNIPQPEPLNPMNIPHPAPIQVQNIPTPGSIQLNEIPNPKPLDLMNIPTPSEDKSISDPDFIKNIPPPNKSVPPPTLPEVTQATLVQQQNLLPPNMLPVSVPGQNLTVQQNVLVHTIPPPQQIQSLQPPNSFTSISVALPVDVVQATTVATVANTIPSLMAQPILPPPGMNVANVNVNCPPPPTIITSGGVVLPPPPAHFANQPPPMTNQMPPIHVPPPNAPPPPPGLVMGTPSGFKDLNAVFPPGTPDYEAMASLGRMVAQCGPGIEDVVRQRKTQDPSLWFLFHKESAAYRQYLQLVEQFRRETQVDPAEAYDPEKTTDDVDIKTEPECNESQGGKRKRKSRWGDKDPNVPAPVVIPIGAPPVTNKGPVMLSKISRTDPGLIQYAITTYGSANLSEEEWKKAEDHYKISLLYQDMMRKRAELERLREQGKNKYDYDSDEETEGGTWEHKLRDKEMMATQLWAQELNRQAEGKHHIGDFLPPDELKKFMEKSTAVKEGRQPNLSDYKEFKIKEDNIGFKMLQKLGWTEGTGLGQKGSGIVDPINKPANREQNQGLGLNQVEEDDDEYESYRKRMMLAYRFRPNPLVE
ncbi:uncharacterized protein LOC109599640 isoform X2 [Aethina tumida]|uniref:uncharacterized protein LOC109599640 isoform X2 n=1 Tax=Aethina tumida TaxID=116153 RepID=UPI0021495B26|nr:uncharacterized protein LOC109599640 isoform X2 [Aethina tumida]